MGLLNFIGYLFGATISIILVFAKIILTAVISGTAFVKGYNPWLCGLITLFLPWPFPLLIFLLIFFIPVKLPKFPMRIRNNEAFKDKNPVIASIMALSAMIAKADGSVTKEEISFIKEFVKSYFNVSHEEINEYADAFDYGKKHPEEYIAFTDMINGYYRTKRNYVMALAFLFVGIAVSEGEDNSSKEEQTLKIVMALGLSQYEYMAIKQSVLRQSGQSFENSYGGSYNGSSYESQESLIKKYSEVLGVSEDAGMSEIKKAYRKLVKEYHPDKLAAGSVPPEYIEFANQKIRDINEAYEYLEKVKSNK